MTTFSFNWDNNPKPSGTVFNKRNKNSSNIKLSFNENSTTFSKDTSTVDPDTPKFIKRKLRKDKLLNKPVSEPQKSQPNSYSLFSKHQKNVYINSNLKGKSVVEKVFSTTKNFNDLPIHKYVVSNLKKHNYTTLTVVQEKSIPLVLQEKNVLIRSQTGSGKTLAYAVPIINTLQNFNPKLKRNDGIQTIIIVPTRELALQTHEIFNKINSFQWIIVGHLCGGENRKTEKDRIRKGVHILIATPGRLLDHILHTTAFKIDKVTCLVLDEADRLLDMGFKKDIIKIVDEINKAKLNSQYDPIALLKSSIKSNNLINLNLNNDNNKLLQTILLSATLTKDIGELADFALKDYIYVDALDESVKSDLMIIPNTVKQEFLLTYVKHKLFMLVSILLTKTKQNSKIFVFMATGQMVDYHYELFTKFLLKIPRKYRRINDFYDEYNDSGDDNDNDDSVIILDIEIFKLHGSMDQNSRKEVFTAFRSSKKGILLCTDVVGRGIDVPETDCIIQYNGPQSDDDYLHRVGRTGRAGKSGHAIILLTYEEQEYIERLQKHKVFLKEADPDIYLRQLCDLMEEPDKEKAATSLQHYFENSVENDKNLHRLACFAYSSWARFYNAYPNQCKDIFNFRNLNLGHYVTSFALKETPSGVSKIVKGQITTIQPKKLNKKLSLHDEENIDSSSMVKFQEKRKIKSISLSTSEYSSGLEIHKKKKKKNI